VPCLQGPSGASSDREVLKDSYTEGRGPRLTAWARKGEEPRPNPAQNTQEAGLNTNKREPHETHLHETGSRHTYSGQPRRPSNRQPKTTSDHPSPSPSARRNRSHAHAKPTATNRVAPKVTCTSEWDDLSAVEGPSKGGLRAFEQLSDRRRHRESQDAIATHVIPFKSFSWARLQAGMRKTAGRAS
jgi:hypothetical protein